jgi:hypothetical protein
MKRFTITASAGLVVVVFAIAGCGGSAATTAPAAATTSGAPAAASTNPQPTAAGSAGASASTSGGGAGAEINACSLLSVAQASSLAGKQYTAATPSTIAPGQDQCDYASADGTDLTVIVYQPSSGVTFETVTSVQKGVGTVTNVSGVGDKAIVGSIELDVQTGDRLIAVEGAGGTLTGGYSGAVAIAKAIIAALPQG